MGSPEKCHICSIVLLTSQLPKKILMGCKRYKVWKRPGASRRQFEMAGKENPWMMEILRRYSAKYAIRQSRWWAAVWMGVLPPFPREVVPYSTLRVKWRKAEKNEDFYSKNKVIAWLPHSNHVTDFSEMLWKTWNCLLSKEGPTWAHLFLDHLQTAHLPRIGIFRLALKSKALLLFALFAACRSD